MGNTNNPSSLHQQFTEKFGAAANYTILVLGQTGSGKTSFMNFLDNLHHVRWAYYKSSTLTFKVLQEFVKETISDESLENAIDDPMASKTSNAKIYQMKMGSVHLTVIDTPGFGDSRGLAEDQAHVKRIMEALGSIGCINCVLLTINGREARLTTTLKYVLSQLSSIMPKSVLNNVAVVFTNTQTPRQLNFQISSLEELGLQNPTHVCLENPLCAAQRLCSTCSEADIGDEDLEDISRTCKVAVRNIESLLSNIMDYKPVQTFHFMELTRKRELVEVLLTNIIEKHVEQELRIKQLEGIKNDIMRTGRVFPKTHEHISWTLEPDMFQWSHYICHAQGCHENCVTSGVVAPLAAIWRMVNYDEKCVNCGHCYGMHRVSRSGWKRHVRTETVNLGDIEKAANEQERKETAIRQLEKDQMLSADEKLALAAKLETALEEYSALGVPSAYSRLLRAQKCVLQERLDASPDDESLQKMLFMVQNFLDELEANSELRCCICMTAFANTVLDCGHKQFCSSCSQRFGTCPLCRTVVTQRSHVASCSSLASSSRRASSGTSSPSTSTQSS